MYIYDALINALSAHLIYINLNTIVYTHVEHSPSKITFMRYYMETHARMHTHTHTRMHTHTCSSSKLCCCLALQHYY